MNNGLFTKGHTLNKRKETAIRIVEISSLKSESESVQPASKLCLSQYHRSTWLPLRLSQWSTTHLILASWKMIQDDIMARNQVQFQKGISLPESVGQFGTQGQCHDALFKWRWPNGFKCPIIDPLYTWGTPASVPLRPSGFGSSLCGYRDWIVKWNDFSRNWSVYTTVNQPCELRGPA